MKPGDIFLVRHGESTISQLIQRGERIRYGDVDACRWTHCGLIVSTDGTTVEAFENGVHRGHLSNYAAKDKVVIDTKAPDELRELAVGFAERHIGDEYGIVAFVGLAIQSLTGLDLSVHMDQSMICSELVARATEKFIVSYQRPPDAMMPADLAEFWGVESREKRVPLPFFSKVLNALTFWR